jgi:hypothetical protein
VDKVAASGGYLMACVADRIIAAPFAIVGSIGVLAQIPNFRRMLDERGVTVEQVKAGRYKRTVSMFGEVTDEDRDKLREELEDVHKLFQEMVAKHRPSWISSGSRPASTGTAPGRSSSGWWTRSAPATTGWCASSTRRTPGRSSGAATSGWWRNWRRRWRRASWRRVMRPWR